MQQGTIIEPERLKDWETKYHKCLALESNDPKYFEVHQVMVLTYMLQTDGYSDACFTLAKNVLELLLTGAIEPREVLEVCGRLEREYHTENSYGNRNPARYHWNMDIMDIGTDGPEQYRNDVRAWGQDVLTVIKSQTDVP